MNIQNIRDNIAALKQNTVETQKQILTQLDIHYEMSFKVQMLETKLSNISGGDPDKGRERKMEFDKLQQHIDNLNKQLSTLNSQSLKLEEAMKNLTVSYNNELKNIEKIVSIIIICWLFFLVSSVDMSPLSLVVDIYYRNCQSNVFNKTIRNTIVLI